jgi:hypothetical protein
MVKSSKFDACFITLDCFLVRNPIAKLFMGDEFLAQFKLNANQFTNEPQEFEFTFAKNSKVRGKGKLRGWYGKLLSNPPSLFTPPSTNFRQTLSPQVNKIKIFNTCFQTGVKGKN